MQLYRQFNRLFIGKVLLSGSNFLILLLLSGFFPSALTGEYYFQITLASTITILLNFGTDNSLFFFVKKTIISLSNLLGLAYRLLYIFFIVAGIILLLSYIGFFQNPAYYIFTAAYIFSLLVQNIFNAYFSGNRQGWKLQAINISINFIFLIFLGIDIFLPGTRDLDILLFSFYGLYFAATVIVLIAVYFMNGLHDSRPPSGKTIKQLFKFGRLPYISNSIFFIGANIDLFFIKYLCNPKLTVYVQAIKIFQMICSVTYLIYYPFMGKILTSSYEQGIETLLRTGRLIISLLLLALIPFYVLCYFFLGRIFPNDTQDIFGLLIILSIAIIATSIAYLYTSYFVAMKKYRQNIISAIIFLVTVIILCIALVPRIGVYGGAIAYSAAILFSLVFDMHYIVRSINAKFADAILFKREDIKIIKRIL